MSDPSAPLMALLAALDVDTKVETRELLDLAVAAFALVLLALSLSAYRKTGLRRLLMVSLAFALFAVEVGLRELDDYVFELGTQVDLIITVGMEFAILLLFFLAVVVRE